jgi:hypothetical protein
MVPKDLPRSAMQLAFPSIRNNGINMANVKQGTLTRPPQWWKHLKDWKRVFWKSERSAQKKDVKERNNE